MLRQREDKRPRPPLPFGHSAAFVHKNINEFTDAVSAAINTLQGYDSVGHSRDFYYASSFLDLNGLKLSASVSSPSAYTVTDTTGYYFFLPVAGEASATVDGKTGLSAARQRAFFSPDIARSGVTTDLSMVQASLCEMRLAGVARSMVGERVFRKLEPLLGRTNYISINSKGVNYSAQFERIFQTIDDMSLNQKALCRLGVDDLFYRTMLSMIMDELGVVLDVDDVVTPSAKVAEKVAEYIAAHYGDEITLTMLEQVSGVSGKSLAKAFNQHFSCSPMQWLQNYRLKTFRHLLQTAVYGETVTSLAYVCGFTRMGALSGRYAQVYGEKPSETLAGSRKH